MRKIGRFRYRSTVAPLFRFEWFLDFSGFLSERRKSPDSCGDQTQGSHAIPIIFQLSMRMSPILELLPKFGIEALPGSLE